MRILVACEESQAVTKELRALGHEAFSCDIIECSGGHEEWHIMQDVLPLLNGNCTFRTCDGSEHFIEGKWDMIIAFPPCTYLCSAGQVWTNEEKYGEKAKKRKILRDDAANFFMSFVNADCEKIAIENPVGVMSTKYRKPNQIIQPYMYGHPFTKSTCLWIKVLPELKPTNIVEYSKKTIDSSYAYMNLYDENGKTLRYSDPRTAKIRSKTFPGVAKAMAEQWGKEQK